MKESLYAWLAVALATLVWCEPLAAQVRPAGPTTPEMLAAMNSLSDAGVLPGRKGSLTFYRWSNGSPPQLVKLGLWGPNINNELFALIKTMPDLDGVSLYETSVDDAGIAVLAQLPKLKSFAVLPVDRYEKLGFGPTQWSYPFIPRQADRPRITGQMLATLAQNKGIENLDLQDAELKSSDLALLSSWPKLASLGLSNVVNEQTVKSLQACPRLSRLTLGNREIAAAEIHQLAAWKSLRTLVVSNARLLGPALEALSELETVESIELINCGLTDEHLQHLRGSPRLVELALPRNEIHGPGLAHLAKLKIKSLGLEFNNVRDETLQDLKQLDEIEEIRLSYCLGVTDRGIASGTLQSMPNLKRLAFRGVKAITDESIAELAKIKNLEHINIRGNGLTSEGCERLQRALPKTVVFR